MDRPALFNTTSYVDFCEIKYVTSLVTVQSYMLLDFEPVVMHTPQHGIFAGTWYFNVELLPVEQTLCTPTGTDCPISLRL